MKASLAYKLNYLFKWQVLILIVVDFLLLPLALYSAVYLRLGGEWDYRLNHHFWLFLLLPIWTIPIFIKLGLYKAVIKFVDEQVVYIVFSGVSISVLILTLLLYFNNIYAFPRTAIIIYWLLALSYIGGSRLIMRGVSRHWVLRANLPKVAIYGAGMAGVQLASSLAHGMEYQPVLFIDDDKDKWNNSIRGLKVYPPRYLKRLVNEEAISMVLLAMPSISLYHRRKIIQDLESKSIYVQTLPGISSLVSGKVSFSDIKTVEIEDLLGRESVNPNINLLKLGIENKVVLVTGAGGSIGSELCRQIVARNPSKLIILDNAEYLLYLIERELTENYSYLNIEVVLGSILDSALIENLISVNQVNTIYHAAAFKHVPMVEHNPLTGIQNNSLGTYSVAKAALKYGVERMILVSTDKAVRPTNIMGASKRLAEMIMQAFANASQRTIFSMVRFGNVLGSSGSVVPLFKEQIKKGGPITITHPDIIRYFMTIPEAVELVIQAGSMAAGGEVFVLDMGAPVKIVDLAKKLVYLSGLNIKDNEQPNGDIELKFTGLRPGEKLYEELLIGDNPEKTAHPRIMKANEAFILLDQLEAELNLLLKLISQQEKSSTVNLLKSLVPEYTPQL